MICVSFDSTRVKIDLDAISQNFDAIQAKAKVPVMAVIKADAYGHGAIQVAQLLQDKAAFFGVSSMLEATELRSAGLLLTKGQLRSIHDELGYIPVCVDKQHPWNAAVCHELTTFGAACTLLPGLLFLVSLVWFLHLIRRKKQTGNLAIRKSKRHRY